MLRDFLRFKNTSPSTPLLIRKGEPIRQLAKRRGEVSFFNTILVFFIKNSKKFKNYLIGNCLKIGNLDRYFFLDCGFLRGGQASPQ
jgi:hypothetical protein